MFLPWFRIHLPLDLIVHTRIRGFKFMEVYNGLWDFHDANYLLPHIVDHIRSFLQSHQNFSLLIIQSFSTRIHHPFLRFFYFWPICLFSYFFVLRMINSVRECILDLYQFIYGTLKLMSVSFINKARLWTFAWLVGCELEDAADKN